MKCLGMLVWIRMCGCCRNKLRPYSSSRSGGELSFEQGDISLRWEELA